MKPVPSAEETLARIERGLRMVTVPMPHLAGLAAAVRCSIDDRVPTMGVFASGRMVANRQFTAKLKDNELVFVLAHELLHLALRTHDRAKGSGRLEFNYAHDYIINDILRAELGFTHVPAGGLDMPGAKEKSAERIVIEMRKHGDKMQSKTQVWDGQPVSARGALNKSGQGRQQADEAGDVMDDAKERELFPECRDGQDRQKEKVEREAAKSAALGKAMGKMKGRGVESGDMTQTVMALRGMYKTPWEMALQKWIQSVAPGERTYLRPSRREVEGSDIVLAGRKRKSWMLNVVLDTSGSMSDEISPALGAIADFCEQISVDEIRLMQCDAAVTNDEMLSPDALANYQVSGFGGSDLTPALRLLADDPRVTATLVITDGDIAYPPEEMPYDVLWVVTPGVYRNFNPPYGQIVRMQGGRMKVVQELVTYFDRRGALSSKQLRGLLEQGFLAAEAPQNMLELCHDVGANYYFRVRGDTEGQIWGTDIYTGDSLLSLAAVHAGLVKPGDTAVVKVSVVAPLGKYPGSIRNNVKSHDFGRYGTAYKLSAI